MENSMKITSKFNPLVTENTKNAYQNADFLTN